MTEMAFAPTAGANGVDPDDPAPMAHAMKRLATAATSSVATVTTVTIVASDRSDGVLSPTRSGAAPPLLEALSKPEKRPTDEQIHDENEQHHDPGEREKDGIGERVFEHAPPLSGRTKDVSTRSTRFRRS
jgi:hypothetical protein